ncbi:MAG TPA: winged helix-turn-helix domain-containing protein [Steroidobacteraceae bacterium]|jgi:two-component system, OmpR family, phosphate regulon response regulator PhoB|nr:winged helix-turn-helix domain-containing protein [Steroidobacteraceae bacterium]
MAATESKKQILIVDQDVAAVEPLRRRLCDAGFDVHVIAGGAAAVTALTERPPHLVILDWNAPGFAALEVIAVTQRVRVPHRVRLILLSALSSEPDVVAAFDLGADDYIAKPYSVREAAARVCAVLRPAPQESDRSQVSYDDLMLDASTNRVTVRGRVLKLRGAEYKILAFLMSHPGKTYNRNQLLEQIWGGNSEVDERTIDVNVQRLRKVLSGPGYEAHIQTVRGFGYRFAAPGQAGGD